MTFVMFLVSKHMRVISEQLLLVQFWFDKSILTHPVKHRAQPDLKGQIYFKAFIIYTYYNFLNY